ncbi:MAG: deaminase [Patescibacteria group bacterium]|nr:deaminase [Patescibacteria group bacterium]
MIIGLTGFNGSGKGEVARYLEKKSFYYYSLSDVIREELNRRNDQITRDSLTLLGNELREQYGPSVLAERILIKLDGDKNYVVDSIRNPGEIEALCKRKDFFLLSVEASPEVRFERIKSRSRENDPRTLAEFQKTEERELQNSNPLFQNLIACKNQADVHVENNSSVEALRKNIDTVLMKLLEQLRQRVKRIDWDTYFMNIAKVVASRSNCIKRKVAALIVKDKRIISTGYNGTPRGVKNCDEGGCPRCNSFVEGGTKLDECLCSHGEENAITQAAYHGISVKDSIMYTTFSPCLWCSKMIINAGIHEVVYNAEYPLNETAMKMLDEAGIKLRKVRVEESK